MFSKYSGKILMFAITLALTALLSNSASAQSSTSTTKEIIPFSQQLTSCTGEEVDLTGEWLVITHTTINADGGIHSKITIVYRNVRGVGRTTGTQYSLVGGERQEFNSPVGNFSQTVTHTQVLNLVSQGGGDNLSLTSTSHITVNAEGEATSIFENVTIRCQEQV